MSPSTALIAFAIGVFVLSFFGQTGYTAALILCTVVGASIFLKGFGTKGWSL